jgi:NodT family efflux transporter outer membrane factor (OMF) lipoprotein
LKNNRMNRGDSRSDRRRLCGATLLGALLLGGCAVGPNYHRPPFATPPQYKTAVTPTANAPQALPLASWWTLFNDPLLNDLEHQVEVSNQNLVQSEAAYRQTVATVREARSALWPTLTGSASASRFGGSGGRGTSVVPGGSGSTTVVPIVSGQSTTTYQANATASWELDVWGRLRRTLENAKESAEASAADLATATLSAQGQLATAYLQLREADAERELVAATVTAYARALQITQNRYDAGQAAKTDVLQAQTQLFTAQDQEASLALQRSQLENSIAALIGKSASEFRIEPAMEWHIPVPDIPVGVPSTLLERRPDIAAAERRMAAANAEIGVEEAAYFPSVTLTGGLTFVSTSIGTLFAHSSQSHTASVGLSDTILDFGARRAHVYGARAAYDQSVATYRQTVITAFQDVENFLIAASEQATEGGFLRAASAAADETERLTLNQYKAGTVAYTNVVVAQTAALSARRSLAANTVSQQTTAVSLATALGGGWLPPPQ